MSLKQKIVGSDARKVRFPSEEPASADESVSTTDESEEGSDEAGSAATCSTCHLPKNAEFLEDLKRGEEGKYEGDFKKAFFERLDRKGNCIPVESGKDGLLLYRELDCCINDFMLNLITNSSMINQKASSFLLKCLHEKMLFNVI